MHGFAHETQRDTLRGETEKAQDDCAPQVCRDQRGGRRQSVTAETGVIWLITQRRAGWLSGGLKKAMIKLHKPVAENFFPVIRACENDEAD